MIVSPSKALLLLVSISFSTMTVAGDSHQAREWLERMTTAMSQMSYQGTFVYVRDGAVETMRITHVTDENGVRERMYSISGPHREVIRDRQGVRCVLQDSAAVVEDQVVASSYFPELPLTIIDGDNSGYRLETGGEARIAGHTARRVTISPEDNYRYGYDFWLEEQTGLLLKWELFDAGHKPIAKLMFTDFVIGSSVNLSELESESRAEDFVEMETYSLEKTVVTQSSPRWQPAKLPPGFHLASHSHKTGTDGVYEHMVYSDGLAAVSVYVEQQGANADVKPGVSQLGTNNAYTRKQGGLQITVIGEVPAITVKAIANEMALSVASN
ncbi:MAG TPA: MucB/RseB C-terminal domain-containing protein [Xanthomonadales bacterium]